MKSKIFLTLIVLIAALLVMAIYQYFKFNDGKLHLIFCNVGQGDGILIRSPKGIDILEDGGPDESISSCLSKYTPFWEREINLMILTHPHAEHMTGLITVLSSYKIGSFASENLRNTTSLYNKLLQILKKNNIKDKAIYTGDSFVLSDGVKLNVLGPTREFISKTPNGEIRESREDASISILVSFGNFNAVLTGDTPIEEMKEILNGPLPKIAVLEIPHHGSKYGMDENLLSSIAPKLAVISVGKNNYGHPTQEVLKALSDLKVKYLRTDRNGDIEIIADKTGKFIVH